MKALSIVLAGATLLSLAACGGKTGEILHDAINNPAKADVKAAYTTGAWKTGCRQGALNKVSDIMGLPFAAYNILETVHTGGKMTRLTTYFADADCNTATLAIDETRVFSIGDNTEGDNWAYDYTVEKVNAVGLSDDAVSKMNTATGYCNINDWKTNEPRDISATAGTPVICLATEKIEVTQFGIVQITGGGNSEVYYSAFTSDRGARVKTADAGPDAVKFMR